MPQRALSRQPQHRSGGSLAPRSRPAGPWRCDSRPTESRLGPGSSPHATESALVPGSLRNGAVVHTAELGDLPNPRRLSDWNPLRPTARHSRLAPPLRHWAGRGTDPPIEVGAASSNHPKTAAASMLSFILYQLVLTVSALMSLAQAWLGGTACAGCALGRPVPSSRNARTDACRFSPLRT